MENEKTIAEELKSVIDEAVATKANASDLEGMVKSDQIEGMVKSEQLDEVKSAQVEALEAAKKEIREEVEAKFASAPAMNAKEVKGMIDFEKGIQHEGMAVKGQTFDFIKSVDTAVSIPGSAVSTNNPFFTRKELNPFRSLATIIPVVGSSFNLPSIGGIAWAEEGTKAANTLRTAGGTLSSTPVTIANWISENAYSVPSLEDVPAMDGTIAALMAQELGAAEATDAVSVLDAGGYVEVNSGVADGYPATAAALQSVLGTIKSSLSPAYLPGSRFLMSRSAKAEIEAIDSNAFLNVGVDGITTLLGYPVQICEYLDAGTADGQKPLYFGSFDSALVMGARMEATVGRFDQTRPGHITYFGQARFKHAVWDVASLVRLNIGA